MKANYGKVKRLSRAECAVLSREAADHAFPAIMAAVLFVLYKHRHWHKDKLVKLYDDVCDLLVMPSVFGQYLDDRQIEQYLADKLGINWDKIRNCIRIEV